jgi:hypothetical protein
MVQYIDALSSELTRSEAFYLDEGAEINLYTMLAHNIIIRRFL